MGGMSGSSIKSMTDRLRAAVRQTEFGPSMLRAVARIGYATYGLLHLILGLLAISAALIETRPPSLTGAFSSVDALPGGWVLLLAIAGGLFAYSGWWLMQAVLDLGAFGAHVKGLFRRAVMLWRAALYAGFGLLAAVIGWRANARIPQGNGRDPRFAVTWTDSILDWPLGHWIVGFIGLGAIGIGISQVTNAPRVLFNDIRAGEQARLVIHVMGRIGLAARGAIFGTAGILFLIAAWRVESAGVGGMRAALSAMATVPLGDWVLLAISAGLILFGLFSLAKALFHSPVKP